MSTDIKTWQERMQAIYGLDTRGFKPDSYMLAEIVELRAALTLAQAPSAPVAPSERAAFCTWYNAIPEHELTTAILKGYSDVAWLGYQARAALSVKAERAAIPEGWQIEQLSEGAIRVELPGDARAIVRERDHATNVAAYVLYGLASDLLAAPTPPTTGQA